MCQIFSFIMNDKGKIFYFDKEQRMKFKESNPKEYLMDSHASICSYYGIDEDEVNKYEFQKSLKEDTKCFDLNNEMQKNLDSFIENLDLKSLVLSSWEAYLYCMHVENDPEIRKLITESEDAYLYCMNIENDPEIRKYITNSYCACLFCVNIKNDPEVRKYIATSYYAYYYCLYIKNDPEVRKYITDLELLDKLS